MTDTDEFTTMVEIMCCDGEIHGLGEILVLDTRFELTECLPWKFSAKMSANILFP
jgi:hypothetical protein